MKLYEWLLDILHATGVREISGVPGELTMPPRIEAYQAWGLAKAKITEWLHHKESG
jgi:thiamine pyrophosphate-dependent acetolactate synthase large subunit-like protein